MLREDIKMNAWTAWLLLSRNGRLTVKEISAMVGCNESFMYLTLGWMMKRETVKFTTKNNILYVELNHSESEVAVPVKAETKEEVLCY